MGTGRVYALNVISSVMFASLSVYSFVLIDSRQLLQMFIDVIDLRRKPLHSSTPPHHTLTLTYPVIFPFFFEIITNRTNANSSTAFLFLVHFFH